MMTLPKDTRIGFLAPTYHPIPPHGYGPQVQYIADLTQGLIAAGYTNITLFASQTDRLPGVKTVAWLPEPLKVHPLPEPRQIEWLHIAHSLKAAAGTIDIIHNNHNYLPLLLGELTDVAMVTTLHGAAIDGDAKIAVERLPRANYLSISDYERSLAPDINYLATVYNPVNFDTFAPSDDTHADYLVNVGRMAQVKGIHHAIALARALGLVLHLAGPVGREDEEYFAHAVKPHIDGVHVIYHGSLGAGEVRDLVSHAAAFVALTEWGEPFGRSVIEAMACGTPVIASPLGAHLETVEPGLTGILASSVDAAVEQFPQVAAIDRAACRERARSRFGIDAVTQLHLAAYAQALASNN